MQAIEFRAKDQVGLISYDNTKDFVAIATEINKQNIAYHAGLIICCEKQLSYFHYTGREVKLEKVNELQGLDNVVIKKIEIVAELEVLTFLGHCERLFQQDVHPIYGFVFNDSYYDPTTKESYLVNTKHDITTCVGCLLYTSDAADD